MSYQPPAGQPPYYSNPQGYPPPGAPPSGYPPPQQPQAYYPPPNSTGYPAYPQSGYAPPQQYPPQGYTPSQGYGYAPPQGYAPQYAGPPQSNYAPGQGNPQVQLVYASTFVQRPSFGAGYPGITPFTMNPQAEADAKAFHETMKGFGTDEKGLISLIASKSQPQLAIIAQAYKHYFGEELRDRVKSETSFHFGDTLVSMLAPTPYVYDCECLFKALESGNTDHTVLKEILIRRSNADIHFIRQTYHHLYGQDLEHVVKRSLSGDLERLYVVILSGSREDESILPNQSIVIADVDELYKAGVGKKFGTDEMSFIRILTSRNDAHLRAVFGEYGQKYGSSFLRAVEKEFSRHLEDALMALVRAVENPYAYEARLLEKTMTGLGTNDTGLSRRIVRLWSRGPDFIWHVKQVYHAEYGKPLSRRIEGETSGDFKKILLAIVGPN